VYRHGPQFRNWLLPEADVVPPDGTNAAEPAAFVPCQPRPPDRSGAMEARVVRTWRKHYKPGGKGARELERLLGRSRAVGITTILVGVPVTSPHRAYYTRDVEEWFVAYMDRLAREYGSRYVDYRDRIPDECFIDHHHMSDAGGLRFSRMLAEEVLVPTLQTGPRPAGR
jgi:hypothetical protein